MTKRVLAIGNCSYDHGNLAAAIGSHFDAEITAAGGPEEALRVLAGGGFDLVLVNRHIGVDEQAGVNLVRQMKADPALAALPVMLLSNFPEAQEEAINAGAAPGFGKAALRSPETIERLAVFLGEPIQR